jgi:hypothetical protein
MHIVDHVVKKTSMEATFHPWTTVVGCIQLHALFLSDLGWIHLDTVVHPDL